MERAYVRSTREVNPTPGEIVLKLYPRDKDGDYWRINHAPIKKLLTWTHGNYEVLKGLDEKTGELRYEIRLRPDTF